MKKREKILFINPCLRQNSPQKYLPVGVGSVMTYVQANGIPFDLFDVDIDDIDNSKVEEFLAKNQYDIVLAGSIVTHYKWMKWMTKTIKKHFPDTVIIIGNSVGGSIPEIFLRNSAADIVIIGEGEITALETIKALMRNEGLNEIQGIAFIDKDNKFVETPKRPPCNVNDLPMINWDLFEVKKYFKKSLQGSQGLKTSSGATTIVMPVTTARGCAFKCTFCHYVFWNDPYRHRAPQNVIAEVRRNIDKYGANYMNFWDDLSFAGLQQAEQMADAILESGLKFNWNAAVRVDLFGHPRNTYDKRLSVAQKFKDAGCLNLGFSLESGNQAILDMMNKKIKREYFTDQVKLLKSVGITCSTSVVFGYPIETKETIQQTFDMCLEVGMYPSMGFLMPLPYTGMYAYAKEHGFITDENKYLDSITERQDFCLNMTTMAEQEIKDHINAGAKKLNEALQLNLSSDRLIKTGGYRRHTKETSASSPYADQKVNPTTETVELGYNKKNFDIDLGLDKETGSQSQGGNN